MTFDEILDELREARDPNAIPLTAGSFVLLAERDREAVTERLRRLLRERHLNLKRGAVIALGQLDDRASASTIRGFLEARNALLRKDATDALGQLQDRDALTLIRRRLDDAKPFVRLAAVDALGALATPEALEALAEALTKEREARIKRAALNQVLALGIDHGEAAGAIRTLLAHAAVERDRELRDRALRHADAVTREMSQEDLLAAARLVPKSLRLELAKMLADRIHDLGLPLRRIIVELRSKAPDRDKLSAFGADLVLRARRGELRRAWHREDLVERIIARLSRDGARSLILVGASGVGKTALVHELARRLADAPVIIEPLLMQVTTGDILSGTRYLGEWQTRLRELTQLLEAPQRVIWYSPDVNRLIDAGMTQKSNENFASMLSPLLESGAVTIIGESSAEQFRRGIDREPSFRKHFQVIRIDEPDPEDGIAILRAITGEFAERCQRELGRRLEVSEDVLRRVATLAEAYIPALCRPGNAVALLEESLEQIFEEGRHEEEEGQFVPGPFGLPRPRPRHRVRRDDGEGWLRLRDVDVTRTLSERTGVPELILNDELPLELDAVRRTFAERVFGQDEAVAVMTDLIALIKSDLTDPRKPLATLFFVGPTGVGKTEMAKALASFLFGSEDRLVRLDMGDFQDPLAYRQLIGDARSAGEAGQGLLTAPIRERPFSVVLLDEIEKAHETVFDLLLPALSDGRLSDDIGRVTDFRRTIIIMTSNIASDLSQDVQAGFALGDAGARKAFEEKVQRRMSERFRPEFLARIDRSVVFKPLSLEIMRDIVRREVTRVLERPGVARRNCIIDADDSVVGLLTSEGFSEQYGARPLKQRVSEVLLKPLARAFLEIPPGRPGPAVVRLATAGSRVYAEVAQAEPHEEERAASGSRARPVCVDDPLDEQREVTTEDLEARLEGYRAQVDELFEVSEQAGFAARKAELLRESMQPDFWQHDPARARQVMSEINNLEKLISTPESLSRRLDTLDDMLDRASRGGDRRRLLKKAAARSGDIFQDLEIAEYLLRCPDRRDRQDAFVMLRRLGEARHASDLTQRLAHMYQAWARRKGFHSRAIVESVEPELGLQQATLLVEGSCAFGLLRGETGLHQFSSRFEGTRRDIDFIRVEVVPEPLEVIRLDPSEVIHEIRSLPKDDGVLIKRPRTHLLLTHQATRVSVEGASARKREDAVADAWPVLEARLAAARERGERFDLVETVEQARERLEVVRKYQLAPQKFVRDLASGIKTFDLESVLGGKLDEFISARIRRRSLE